MKAMPHIDRHKDNAIHRRTIPVQHRDEEYDQSGFDTLWAMQEKHFWYRGRHRFLLGALNRYQPAGQPPWSAVDLGGVGGWIRYLADRRPTQFSPLALADSSETALCMAGDALPTGVARYQIDLSARHRARHVWSFWSQVAREQRRMQRAGGRSSGRSRSPPTPRATA